MNPSSDLHVPLDKPPQAISLTVRSLLSRVVSGGIRVPEFQRPLRWRSDDVVKLFDSLVPKRLSDRRAAVLEASRKKG